MKTLLVNMPKTPTTYFPLGLAYIAGSILDIGHEVDVLDLNYDETTEQEIIAKLNLKLVKTHYDIIGISAFFSDLHILKLVSKEVKNIQSDAVIIAGGPISISIPEITLLKTDIDIVCIGEGEETIKDIVITLSSKSDLNNVKGIAYKFSGEIITTTPRTVHENFRKVTDVPWHLFDLEKYLDGFIFGTKREVRSLNISSSRGCPFKCTFCCSAFGKKVFFRPLNDVIEEIKYFYNHHNVRSFLIFDELFTIKKDRAIEFCKMLINEKLDITWAIWARVDTVDKEFLTAFQKSGGCFISFGIESGSKTILDELNKGIDPETSLHSLRLSQKMGIGVHANIILGSFSESEETIKDTNKLLIRSLVDHFVCYLTPIPGTELFNQAVSRGKLSNAVEDIDKYLETGDSARLHELRVNLTSMPNSELTKHTVFAAGHSMRDALHIRILRSKVGFFGIDTYAQGKGYALLASPEHHNELKQELRLLVNLVQKYGISLILDSLSENTPSEEDIAKFNILLNTYGVFGTKIALTILNNEDFESDETEEHLLWFKDLNSKYGFEIVTDAC